MKESVISESITNAAVSMLKPFYPTLTREKLETAILIEPSQEQETLLSRKEAAAALHVSLPTIDRCLKSKQISRVNVRGRTFIRASEVKRIIAGGE